MDSEGFRPSVDWSNELVNSALWVAKAFGCQRLAVVLVLLLVGRFTEWGRQFWRITGDYFVGRASVPVWLVSAALLVSVVAAVRINVLLSYYANDLFSALQVAFQGSGSSDDALKDSGIDGFWLSMGIFAVLATIAACRFLLDLYLTQRFVLRWRVWLTRRVLDDWLDGHAYFRGQFAARPIDNPDQRIQQDIDIVTAVTGEAERARTRLGRTAPVRCGRVLLSVASFGVILWHLSGPLTVLERDDPRRRCSGSSSPTCSRPRSSPSGSAGR